MKNSIIFISALSLVAMMLASCSSVFAPDETATTGEARLTNETSPERSAEGSVNSMSGGHY
jgi:PBP1b-binding outer membrane lipoprotein LpoB